MTPKVKIFENVLPDSSTGHRTTVVARLRGLPNKNKLGLRGIRPPAPILAKIGRSRSKFPERCPPDPLASPMDSLVEKGEEGRGRKKGGGERNGKEGRG